MQINKKLIIKKEKIKIVNTYSMENITYNFIKSNLDKYFNESKNS